MPATSSAEREAGVVIAALDRDDTHHAAAAASITAMIDAALTGRCLNREVRRGSVRCIAAFEGAWVG